MKGERGSGSTEVRVNLLVDEQDAVWLRELAEEDLRGLTSEVRWLIRAEHARRQTGQRVSTVRVFSGGGGGVANGGTGL